MTTSPTSSPAANEQREAATLRWRIWPLVEQPRWAPSVAVGLLSIGGLAWGLSDSWLLAAVATASVVIALWQYLLPVTYEIHSLGVYRHALGRTRLLPWHAIHAYQPRSTGIILLSRRWV